LKGFLLEDCKEGRKGKKDDRKERINDGRTAGKKAGLKTGLKEARKEGRKERGRRENEGGTSPSSLCGTTEHYDDEKHKQNLRKNLRFWRKHKFNLYACEGI
jgi:hypothetical protein